MVDLMVKNCTIVTVNSTRDILYDSALVINDGIIKDIDDSERIEKEYSDEAINIIDAEGKIIFPGLINTHTHLFQTLLKGLGDDLAMSDWFASMTGPCAAHLEEEDVYYSALMGCIDAIKSGTTTILDYMYAHPKPHLSDGIIKAFRELGIRGYFGRGTHNSGEQFGTPPEIMQDVEIIEKDCRRLFDKYHKADNGRIRIWLAPAAIWSNTEKLLVLLRDLADEYDTGITAHISETPFDRKSSMKKHGYTDIKVLEELDILGPNVLMVHCVHLTNRDIRMVKYYDMKISYNPVSNMYLASGVAPIPQITERGIDIGLATDGAASNNSQDMIEVLKNAALLQKVHTKDPTVITAEKILEMATIDGAKALNMEEQIGSIEIGKKADLFIYNPQLSPKSVPMHNPVSTLVYSGTPSCVETVVVDGNILVKNREFTSINEKDILNTGQKIANKLVKRAGVIHKKNRPWRSMSF